MTAAGHCMTCGITFISAAAWHEHQHLVHQPKDEIVCAVCALPFAKESFAWHPCIGRMFDAREDHR